MKMDPLTFKTAEQLRQLAEDKLLSKHNADSVDVFNAETHRLLHELQVHQVELELQNDDLVLTRNNLELALERYTDLYDFAPSGYFTLSPSGIIENVNHVGAHLLCDDRSHLISQSFASFLKEKDRLAFRSFLEDVMRNGMPCHCELELSPNNKGPVFVWAEARASACDKDCRLMLIDITERKKLLLEQTLLREQLIQSQKTEMIGQLAGGIAHDFNNMLCAMMLQLNLLDMKPDKDLETAEAIEQLRQDATRAARLTQKLLQFSRCSQLNRQTLSVNDTIANFMSMLRRLIGEDYELLFKPAENLPSIHADASGLEQTVLNLVVNARDAMPTGGSIIVETRVVSFSKDAANTHAKRREGSFICIQISDTGVGIPPEILPHIFEPFFTTKDKSKGSGLGLSTIDGLVAQHKGWIEVTTEQLRGSTFQVFLPAE